MMVQAKNMREYQSIEAIVFDLGNVLINIDFDRSFQAWGDSSGQDWQKIKTKYQEDLFYEKHERNEVSGQQYYQYLNKKLGLQIGFPDFVEGWNRLLIGPIQETFRLINQLESRYPLYILTNSNVLHRQYWSQQLAGKIHLFDQVFCSSLLQMRKPEERVYKKVLGEINKEAPKVLFIDDRLENLQGAEKLGIQSFQFGDPETSCAQLQSRFGL